MCKIIIANSIIFILVLANCDAARILGFIPTASYSHQVAFQPIWRELSLRGHQLTVLTTHPMNDPSLTNLTEIDLHFACEPWNKVFDNLTVADYKHPTKFVQTFFSTMSKVIEMELQHGNVQKLIKNETEHFDLLMVEFLFPTGFAFAQRFNCPYIALTSLDPPSAIYQFMGNPVHPVANPDFTIPAVNQLSFLERLKSVFLDYATHYMYTSLFAQEQLTIEKNFGKGYAPLEDFHQNISMLFVNADPILHRVRPTVPGVIHIGGGNHLHTQVKVLPLELKQFLDGASKGFIYFSLGSIVKTRYLSETTRKTLLEAFSELPYRVLWKCEWDNLPGKPKNVMISKWFPQQDIFKHPNIKLFITQGGLQSMEEAVYNHIPMLGMPFFADQEPNVKRMEAKGLGLYVDYENINKEDFKKIILEVVENPKYHKKVKELAQLAQDKPMTGLERAVWWTEYVLRHKGARHLRSPFIDLPSYQYFLLDVVGFGLMVVAIIIYMLVMLVRMIVKLIKYFTIKPKVKVQ